MNIPKIKENETKEQFYERGLIELKSQGIEDKYIQTILYGVWTKQPKLIEACKSKMKNEITNK